jgi:hypothetical protein
VHLSAALAGEVEARLAGYVRHVLERDVRSAHFLETLRREAAAPANQGAPP